MFGVEPEAGDDGRQSLHAGRIVEIPPPRSIADGALTPRLGNITFPLIQQLVEDVLVVPDALLVKTMAFFAERMKILVEPTGCLAAAAVMEGVAPVRGLRVGVVISGGNVDLATFAKLTGGG